MTRLLLLSIIGIILVFTIIVGILSKGLYLSKIKRGIDKALSKSHFSQIILLAFLIVFVFLLLVFFSVIISPVECHGFWPRFWHALSHFFNPGSFYEDDGIPNIWILFINIFGMVLMTGLLISVLSNLLERRIDNLKTGRIHYKFKNHFVIIGYDKMTIGLIKQLMEDEYGGDIILQTVQNAPSVRHELFSYLDRKVEKRVVILNGNRNSVEDLEKLSLARAKRLFVLGESQEYDHDSLNIECLKKINKIIKKPKRKTFMILKKSECKALLPCHVLFENQSTYLILQQRDLEELRTNKEDEKSLDFLPFNFHEKWAENLFIEGCYKSSDGDNVKYLPLDRVSIDEKSVHTVHLVIVGMSKIGVALGIEATQLCHFPNFIKNKKLKTRITFIDKKADQEMNFLKGRYQSFFDNVTSVFEDIEQESVIKTEKGNFTDVTWNFIKGNIEHPTIQQRIEDFSKEKNTLLTIAICLNNPAAAIAAGMYLKNSVYELNKIQYFEQFRDRMGELQPDDDEWNLFNVQILIKQDSPYSILSTLESVDKYRNIRPFGMLDNCLDISEKNQIDVLAKRINYVYQYYFDEETYGKIPDLIPDDAVLDKKWDKIPIVEKWSNRYHAKMLKTKQRSFDMVALKKAIAQHRVEGGEKYPEIINLIAEVEHNRWNTEKLLLGFRPASEEEEQNVPKNKLKRAFIHPDIKDFKDERLKESTKDIDRMITKCFLLICGNNENDEKIQS